jgi:hypothetical protein
LPLLDEVAVSVHLSLTAISESRGWKAHFLPLISTSRCDFPDTNRCATRGGRTRTQRTSTTVRAARELLKPLCPAGAT